MALETGDYLDDLVITNPTGGDAKSQGDDHLRLIKKCVTQSFPYIAGAVSASDVELSYMDGVTSAVQTQMDLKAPLASPTLTGVPVAPTAAVGTDSTQIATTAFVEEAVIGPTSTGGLNLLINSNFVLNQEDYDADGVAELEGGEYGHDMWESVGAVNSHVIYTKETNGDITIDSLENTSATAEKYVGIQQNNDEMALAATDEEEITISIYVVSFTTAMNIYHAALGLQALELGWNSFTFTSNTAGLVQLKLVVAVSTTSTPAFRFNSFKVERGGSRSKYQVPEPVAEANRCYYYYLKSQTINTGIAAATGSVSDVCYITISTPVKMRYTAAASLFSTGYVYDGTVSRTVSTIAVDTGGLEETAVRTEVVTTSTFADWNVTMNGAVVLDARY